MNNPRINHRLDCDRADRPPAERRPEPAYAGRFARIGNLRFDTAGAGDYRRYCLKVAGLRDIKLAGGAAAARGYFLGTGNS